MQLPLFFTTRLPRTPFHHRFGQRSRLATRFIESRRIFSYSPHRLGLTNEPRWRHLQSLRFLPLCHFYPLEENRCVR